MLLENSHYEHDSRVRPESEALVSQGYRVTVINRRWPGGKRHEVMNGVHIYTFPMPETDSGFMGYVVEYLYATVAMFVISLYVLMRRGFDIVHTHNPPDILFLIAGFYKLFGKRFVYDHHDLGPELYDARFGTGAGNWLVHQMLVWGEKIACGLADRVIATNESYKVMEMTRSHVPAERISIVRNGPDLTSFHLVPGDPGLRERAGTLLGYVGVMGPQDGVDYLLRSLQHLVYDLKQTDIFCVIIGRGDTMQQLKTMAHDLKIEPYLWFTGWVSYEDMLCYLSTIDIGVDPDPSNAFNDRCTMIKIMNYMAMGKPVVAFDLPEHRVTADSAAVYARPNDELDFARQIAALIADPERRARMGQAGLRRVETELAWPFQAQELIRAYGDLTASFARPARAERRAER
jgi:glycosyltransferase involved in cell wall biosynthesis